MVYCKNQDALRTWLCARIGLIPTKDIKCIGSVLDGDIRGVVGFDGYNGASIAMHIAGDPGWLNRDLLKAVLDYPFNVCKVKVLLAYISASNEKSMRLAKHFGFKVAATLDGAHPDGDLVLLTMQRDQCRFYTKEM